MNFAQTKYFFFRFRFQDLNYCFERYVLLQHSRTIRDTKSDKELKKGTPDEINSYGARKQYSRIQQYGQEQNIFKGFRRRFRPEKPCLREFQISDNPGMTHTAKYLQTAEEAENTFNFDSIDDEEYDEHLMHSEEFHDMHEDEIKQYVRRHRQTMIKKKYFKSPPETCLLTCAAKEQIFYLNQMDSDEWIPEKLAESFPVSIEGVKKLLKNRHVPKSEEHRQKHDEIVRKNWKLLLAGDKQHISPVTRSLWEEGKLNLQHYGKIPTLPCKPTNLINECKLPDLPSDGPFLAMIKPYLTFKQKQIEQSVPAQAADNENDLHYRSKESRKKGKDNYVKIIAGGSDINSEDQNIANNVDNPTTATYLQKQKLDYTEPAVTHEQFKENVLNSYGRHKGKSDDMFRDWVKEIEEKKLHQQNSNNFAETFDTGKYHSHIQKYDTSTIELTMDEPASKTGSRVKQSFIYDHTLGYQHPVGMKDEAREKIKIPAHLYKKGAIYKVNNCYYDDHGDFLYKAM